MTNSLPSAERTMDTIVGAGHSQIDLVLRNERDARRVKKPRQVKHVQSKKKNPKAKPLSQSEFDQQFAEAVAKRKARQAKRS